MALMARFVVICSLSVVMLVATVPAGALVLYDNFDDPFIDPDKWFGTEGATDAIGAESAREINRRGMLRIFHRAYGVQSSNSGTGSSGFRSNFNAPGVTDPSAVTEIKATVQVKSLAVTGCPANPTPSQARARIGGFFFNTGTATPGDGTNDVFADIRLRRRSDSTGPPRELEVRGNVFLCGDADCIAGTSLAFLDLGTALVGRKVMLRIKWDPANNRFIFQKDSDPEVIATYGVTDPGLPGINRKRLEVSHVLARCISDRTMASMETVFDDVFVNDSATP